jgi:hypothetical protein
MNHYSRECRPAMKIALGALVLCLAFGGTSHAEVTCQNSGNYTYCNNGQTFYRNGNYTYDNRGHTWQQTGNFTYSSKGKVYQRNGNYIYDSRGHTWRQTGDYTYGPHGACQRVGAYTYCN